MQGKFALAMPDVSSAWKFEMLRICIALERLLELSRALLCR